MMGSVFRVPIISVILYRYTVYKRLTSLSLTNRQFNGQFKGILACFRYVLTYRVV